MENFHEGGNPTIKNKVYPETQAYPSLYNLSNPKGEIGIVTTVNP